MFALLLLLFTICFSPCVTGQAVTCPSTWLSNQGWPRATGTVVQSDIQIAPNDQTVVYLADTAATAGIKELWAVPIGGGTPVKLNKPLATVTSTVFDFRISPDSTRVIYRANADTDVSNELYSVPIGGGASAKLNPVRADGDVDSRVDYRFSPDGSMVVFRGSFKQDAPVVATYELYKVPIAGGTATRISNAGANTLGMDVEAGTWQFFSATGTPDRVVYVGDTATINELEVWTVGLTGTPAPFKLNPNQPPATSAAVFVRECGGRVIFTGQFEAGGGGAVPVMYSADPQGSAVGTLVSQATPPAGVLPPTCSTTAPARVLWYGAMETAGVQEVYSRLADGSGAIVKLSPATTNNPVTLEVGCGGALQLTPDGLRVLWIANSDNANVNRKILYASSVSAGTGLPVALPKTGTTGNQDVLDFKISSNSASVVFRAQLDVPNGWLYLGVPNPTDPPAANTLLNSNAKATAQVAACTDYMWFDDNTVTFIGDFQTGSTAKELYRASGTQAAQRLSGDSGDNDKEVTSMLKAGNRIVYQGDLSIDAVPEVFSALVSGAADNGIKLNTPIGFGESAAVTNVLNDNTAVIYTIASGTTTLQTSPIDMSAQVQISKPAVPGGTYVAHTLNAAQDKVVYTGTIDSFSPTAAITDMYVGCSKVQAPTVQGAPTPMPTPPTPMPTPFSGMGTTKQPTTAPPGSSNGASSTSPLAFLVFSCIVTLLMLQ